MAVAAERTAKRRSGAASAEARAEAQPSAHPGSRRPPQSDRAHTPRSHTSRAVAAVKQEKGGPSPEELLRAARQHFGIKRFRAGQREILDEVFAGRGVLGLLPTGAGKSLTYQLPALFLPRPVVVVSPLIALMQDQQEKAAGAEIAVEKIDSTLTKRETAHAVDEIEHGAAQLIYVTPERLETREFLQMLQDAGGISLLVVDEAHCIAQWGHDFRPAYLCIGEARKTLGMPPVLALTATATEEVVHEILESLHATGAKVVNTGIERANLSFSVHPTVNAEAKLARITELLEREEGTGIIYTASVRSANELHDWLREHGIAAGHYHGKMQAREREQVQQAFMRGEHKVMIATKAFGLGIDKPDIRFVYHYEFPDSLETYYQEAGRAGRDGLPSRAVLLYRLEDKRIQSFFLGGRYPHIHELQAVWLAVSGPVLASADAQPSPVEQNSIAACVAAIAKHAGVGQRRTQVILHLLTEAGLIRRGRRGYTVRHDTTPSDEALASLLESYADRAASDKDRLAEMMRYAETVDCRVQVIRQYFGDEAGEPCGRCDNCEQNAAGASADGHTARVLHDAEEQTAGRTVALAAASEAHPHRAGEAHDGGEVTRVETMHGTIVTTAPETLPQTAEAAAPTLRKSDRVRHKRFGEGTVRDVHDDVALVHFAKGGNRRVKISYLARTAR